MSEPEKNNEEPYDGFSSPLIVGSRKLIKWISLTFVAIWIVSGISLSIKNSQIQLALIFFLIPMLATLVLLTFLLLNRGEGRSDWKIASIGWFFIIGGVLWDIGATIYNTPDLKKEANPIAKTLFNNGFSIPFVYCYGIVAQILILLWGCFSWGAFIRHRENWIEKVMLMKPKAFSSFFRLSYTGKPLGTKGKMNSYFSFWFVVPLFLGIFLERWLLGFHWFNLLSIIPKTYGIICGPIIAYIIFFIWLYLEYDKRIEIKGIHNE